MNDFSIPKMLKALFSDDLLLDHYKANEMKGIKKFLSHHDIKQFSKAREIALRRRK